MFHIIYHLLVTYILSRSPRIQLVLYAYAIRYAARCSASLTFTLHPRSDTTHDTAHTHGPHRAQTHQHWLTDTRNLIPEPARQNHTESRNHTKHSTQQRGTGQNKMRFPFRVVVGK
jgi:hypothetical protein